MACRARIVFGQIYIGRGFVWCCCSLYLILILGQNQQILLSAVLMGLLVSVSGLKSCVGVSFGAETRKMETTDPAASSGVEDEVSLTGHHYDLIQEMLSNDEFVQLPVTYNEFKHRLRDDGLSNDSQRRVWWPTFFTIISEKVLRQFPDYSRVALRKYRWATQHGHEENLPIDLSWGEDNSQHITFCVIKLLMQHYDIQDPGLIHPLVQIISKVLTNKAICYYVVTEIIQRPIRYLVATASSHRVKLHAFRELCKRCMIHTWQILDRMGALEEKYLNLIFVDIFSTILPDEDVNSIMDVYLFDGVKVLYRYGLALFKLHKRRIKSMEFKTGNEFWNIMKRYKKEPKKFDFGAFHDFAFDRSQSVVKKRIVPPRASIQEYEQSALEVFSSSQLSAPLNLPYELSITSAEDARNLLHKKSKILDLFMARRLHSYLPTPMRMEGFELKFATYLDGWNLSTLYSLVEGCSPCLILIKSVEMEAVVGVYVSSVISPPSSHTRGDGSCFCFRLDGPDGACYRWALINHQYVGITLPTPTGPDTKTSSPSADSSTSPTSLHSPDTTDDGTLHASPEDGSSSPSALSTTRLSVQLIEPNIYLGSATFHQFAHCTVDYMAFGGSNKHGTNALRITSDLMLCSSGHSDTYNNPSLTPDEPTDPWYVAEIEVFCGTHSVMKQRS